MRRITCLLGRHRWQQLRTDDNDVYEACTHCGEVKMGPPGSYGEGGIPPGAIPSV